MSDIDDNKDESAPLTASPADTAEPMRLRGNPPRVTRLSRRVLAGIGLVAALGVGGALIYALQTPEDGVSSEELYSTENRSTADGLNELPRDYTGPVLGPALPGDLGRPILDAQERGRPVVPPTMNTPAVDPEEQRRLAEEEAARTSRVFFQTTPATANSTPAPETVGLSLGGQPPAAQNSDVAFLSGPVDRRTVAPDRVMPPASPYVLQAGSVIPAALITGIRSDLPGQITAQVTRIIGEYSNDVGFGQRRVLLVWNRLIFPNGRSIVLERQSGADTQGYAGLEDGVDYHWWDIAKAAALSTLLGVGAELAADDNDRLISAIRGGAQDTINDAGQQIVRRQLNVAPTLTIRPGFPVRVVVTRDLVLEPYGG
jgi:type IV secretion system protein VirB10